MRYVVVLLALEGELHFHIITLYFSFRDLGTCVLTQSAVVGLLVLEGKQFLHIIVLFFFS
jgi:hypothetical protein